MPTDPFYQRRASRRHYEANTQAYKDRATAQRRARKIAARGIIREAKNVPCADCHMTYPYYVMQFDHVRGEKLFDVGTFIATNLSIRSLHREIAKCEVVCANCHAERTHRRRAAAEAKALAPGPPVLPPDVDDGHKQAVLFLDKPGPG